MIAPRMSSGSQSDDLVASRSDTDIGDWRFDKLLDSVEIRTRSRWKIFQRARVGRRRAPAGERFVNGLGVTQHGEIAGKFGEHVLAHAIRGAESDLVQRIQHVELGDCKIRESVDAHRVAHDYRVEPAAAPRTSRSRAKFIPELAHLRLQRLGELGWQR